MLTDEQIEQVLYRYTNLQDEFNLSVMRVITERLTRMDDIISLYSPTTMTIMENDIKTIKKLHKNYIKKQQKQLEDDFWWIAIVLYAEAETYYDYQVALELNTELTKAIEKLQKQAQESIAQLLKTPVFVIRDQANPGVLKPQSLSTVYRSIINEAFAYRHASADLRNIALKRTETQLFDSGIRYMTNDTSDDSKRVTSANNAIRFNVLDSIKNLIVTIQDIMGKQFGANGFELSAHIFPAPDHAPAQGHQFTKKEVEKMQSGSDFEDVNGTHYIGFERNIGQWNCRHYFMQIKLGTKQQYSQEQLDKILAENEKGYTDAKGKHRTLYECTQVQRRYEREIRNAKEKYLYGKMLNDKQMMAVARNRVGKLTTQYKQFSKACDIPAKLERLRVKGYQ